MCPTARHLAIALALSIAIPRSGMAGEHLVTPAEIASRLQASAAERPAQEMKIRQLLARHVPAVKGSAAVEASVRARVAALTDDELRDLARRADALETDPVAGGLVKTLLILGIVVLVVVLLAAAVVESCKEQGAECLD
jgi:hypothetical protein